MPTINHKDLPETSLHEPKGVSTASVGTVYVSDGAGSGSWVQAPYTTQATCRLADVSTASSAYSVAHTTGTISKIYTVLEGVITVADANMSFFINGTPITGSGIVVGYSGSAAGDVDNSTPSAANAVVPGDRLTATSDGASTTTAGLQVVFVITAT